MPQISLKRAPALLLVTAFALGCDLLPWPPLPTDPGPGPGPAPGAVTRIEFGKHYGFCAGYCTSDLTLNPDGTGQVVYTGRGGRGADEPPPIVRDVVLGAAERDAIFREADKVSSQPWQPQYGCPDCTDGGAWPLAVTRRGPNDASTQKTVLDPFNMPPLFADLAKLLGNVMERHPRAPQITTCPAGSSSSPGVTVTDFALKGDEASFKASFGGGCAPHQFELCWDGAFLESFPVQARLQLLHKRGADDPCDALLTRNETFNLSPLREAYQKGYQTQNGKISVSVSGKNGASALYEF